MADIDLVIVLCGVEAFLAKGIAAELTIAQEKNTPYFLLEGLSRQELHKASISDVIRIVYKWTWDDLKTLIGGWR